ncbi:hypothetical protein F5879DRAFT_959800 [Lentinula edodes]|nr:hypothetical protein F5879DRAFT_959800 [Lentinula edodes]
MAPKAPKRSAKSSSSASSRTAVDPSVSAYTLEIYRKRNALSRLPINDYDEEDSACTGKRKAANNAESVDDIRDRIVKVSKAAHWNPADGRWATVRQLLQLTCTRGRDFRWIVPEKKQIVASPPLELRLWSEQVSELLRRKWKPRSGPEYEKELLYRAQKEWVPTESYPTRETAVVKQILEKREWEADILELVQQWLASSTQDGSTEIRVLLAKKKLVDSLKPFLDALLPQDAPDAARVKNFQKEHWVTEVTHFFKQNGAPTLTRNSTSNLSVASKERKSVALHEKVKTWQQTLLVETKDRPRRASDAPSEASSSKSKTKRKETAESTTALRKSAQSVAKQSSLEFAASKSSATKLAGKPKASVPRDPPRVDDDLLSNDFHHDVHIGLPSQPLSFRSSQIKHSTPKDGTGQLVAIEEPAPSSSPLSPPPLHTSPSRPPRIISVPEGASKSSFKRPQSPSSATNSRPAKQARIEKNIAPVADNSPMKVDSLKSHHTTNVPIPPPPPSSSPLSPPPATPDEGNGNKKRVPTLMELLSVRKTTATPMKRKNTLTIISTPLTGRAAGPSRNQLVVAASGSGQRTSMASALVSAQGEKPQAPLPAPSTRRSDSADANDHNARLKITERAPSSVAGPSNSNSINQTAVRAPPTAVHETQTFTSAVTSTYSVQHQPEFTASGYAIDLPLSVIDGFVGHGGSDGGSVEGDGVDGYSNNNLEVKDKGKAIEGKSPKKRGYFGMEDVDLTSPTKLRPGVVRPFAGSSSEDEDEDDGGEAKNVTPKNKISTLNASQLPDFTHDFDAFDPPQASTQPRRKSNGGSTHGGGGNLYSGNGFGAAPWANGVNDGEDDDFNDNADSPDYGYVASQSIFTKDGAINVRSFDDDPTVHSQAFFSIPGLESPIKKTKKNKGWTETGRERPEENDGFGFGYSSQFDVDGDVEMVSKLIDRDVDLMDVDADDKEGEGVGEGNSVGDQGHPGRDRSRVMWGGWS